MIARISLLLIMLASSYSCTQKQTKIPVQSDGNSLLWEISGNGLNQSSYLYGTMHIICEEYAGISENFRKIIDKTDAVYLEIDMDDMAAMMSAVQVMKMKADTTLEDLLNEEELEKVQGVITEHSPLPYSMVKAYHPIITATLVAESFLDCKKSGIEETIMEVAKQKKIPIEGLETPLFQMSVIDQVGYREQARYLMDFIDSVSTGYAKTNFQRMFDTYLGQNMKELDSVMFEIDPSILKFAELLLYSRNRNWVEKLKKIMPGNSFVFAVGAGHLPGEQGIISLLRKQGYTVTALENKLSKKK